VGGRRHTAAAAAVAAAAGAASVVLPPDWCSLPHWPDLSIDGAGYPSTGVTVAHTTGSQPASDAAHQLLADAGEFPWTFSQLLLYGPAVNCSCRSMAIVSGLFVAIVGD